MWCKLSHISWYKISGGSLLEEAKKGTEEIRGFLTDPAPFVRFSPGFGESSLDFTLICRVNTFVDQYYAQHALRKRIFARFREEGIEIPFPQRDVHLHSTPTAGPQVPERRRPDGAASGGGAGEPGGDDDAGEAKA